MKTRILLAVLLVIGTVFLRGDGCIMKDKVTDLIAYIEICQEFMENEDSAQWNDPEVFEFDVEVDKELEAAGYTREEVVDARFVVGHYGALNNNSAHDWIIGGSVKVARTDQGGADVVAMNYTTQSINAAIGQKIKADVQPAAIDVINQAIQDYLAGQTGIILTFTLDNQSAQGPGGEDPSPADPMIFDWKAWIELYVEVTEEVEWPDPF